MSLNSGGCAPASQLTAAQASILAAVAAIPPGGFSPPISLVQANAVASFAREASVWNATDVNARAAQLLSGALVAGTLKTIINITGSGVVTYLSASVIDATARTLRVKVTLDGIVIYDYTSAGAGQANSGAVIFGSADATGDGEPMIGVPFISSFKVEIASSLSETDLLGIGYRYWLT